MTQALSENDKDKVVSLLAQYLKGRSEVFQNKVYELVIQYGWDVNDPAFAILLATGQMETILESFPEQFEALFLRLMQESQQAFIRYQQLFEAQQGELRNYIQGVEAQQSQSMSQLQESITAFNLGIEAQRQSNLVAIGEVFNLAKQRRAEFLAEAKAQLKPVEKQFIEAAAHHARGLMEMAEVAWNKKALHEIIWLAGGLGAIIFTAGFAFGVFVNQTYVNRFSENFWATKLWVWNQNDYSACVEARKTTCNFHIVPPKNK